MFGGGVMLMWNKSVSFENKKFSGHLILGEGDFWESIENSITL